MLLIQASNIHTGGGATLLTPLLQVPFNHQRIVWVDSRFKLPDYIAKDVEIRLVKNNILARLKADVDIAKISTSQDTLLCLGNLPPIMKPSCKVLVYLHNKYLVSKSKLTGLPAKDRLRLSIERYWFYYLKSHAHQYFVQTKSMSLALRDYLNIDENKIIILPYLPSTGKWPISLFNSSPNPTHKEYNFLYVASGEPHKNHRNLILAWIELSNEGYYPKLQLTLDKSRYNSLTQWIIYQSSLYHLKIDINTQDHAININDLYINASALIYPSNLESFGLPIIEARQTGLPVLAPELDYVRDIVTPDEVFNAESPRSIARAVKRFMGVNEHYPDCVNAEEFINIIVKLNR